MYLMLKIHKPGRLKTRAIISYSASICYGIAEWIDSELKKIIPHLSYVCKSSHATVNELRQQRWDNDTFLFTCDAKSMYTNIHLKHALPEMENFLLHTPRGRRIVELTGIKPSALFMALEIVMENNIFQFGDSFWRQLTGTAMGTPPAPDWSTLYFCIWEIVIIPKFPEILLYLRYIDDGLGAWKINVRDPEANRLRFEEFKLAMNSYGSDHDFFINSNHQPLQWEFSELTKHAEFLDLNISLQPNGTVKTWIFEKK